MRRIVLHVGPGKCGSSSVQAAILRPATALHDHLAGVLLQPAELLGLDREQPEAAVEDRFHRLIARAQADHPGKVLVLSHEMIFKMVPVLRNLARIARAHADVYGIDPKFNEKMDIHVHVPAGATPKDGPSAGVTLVTALISALTDTPVSADVAMTGEISLRGRVLPVGGIKEKILAAVSRGMKKVLIPAQNKKDLADIPDELRKRIVIKTIDRIEEVWPLAKAK